MPDSFDFEPSLTLDVPGYGVVTASELAGSPVYLFTHNGSRVERTYVVAWAARDAFVKGVLGFCGIGEADTGNANKAYTTYVKRHTPHAMLDVLEPRVLKENNTAPDVWLYATQVTRMEGLEPTGLLGLDGVPAHNWAQVTVLYEGLTYKVKSDAALLAESVWIPRATISGQNNPDPKTYPWEWFVERYVTRMRKPSAEYLALGRGRYRWVDDNRTTFPEATAVLQASMEVVYTWHQVPFLPRAARLHIGKVNADFFDPEHEKIFLASGEEVHGFTPGTLLYSSCEVRPYRMGSGGFVQDITYRMKYMERPHQREGVWLRGRGHNYFLKWDATNSRLDYFKVTSDGNEDALGDPFSVPPKSPSSGRPVYDYANFRDLFCLYPRGIVF